MTATDEAGSETHTQRRRRTGRRGETARTGERHQRIAAARRREGEIPALHAPPCCRGRPEISRGMDVNQPPSEEGADRCEQMCNNSGNYRHSPRASVTSTSTPASAVSVCPPNFCLGSASPQLAPGGMDLHRHGRAPGLPSPPSHQ
ncbi:unnamed protein product [Arctogadus glacialis]